MSILGKELKKARIDAGLTQGALAALTTLTAQHISRIERGRDARFATVARLAWAVGLSLDMVLAKEFREEG